MTAVYFVAFVVATAGVVIALAVRYLPRTDSLITLGGLIAWLSYVGLMSYLGVVRNPALRPPGIVYILLPVFLFVGGVLVRSKIGLRIAAAFPLWLLLLLPAYRVGVELFLHQLWREGLVPRMLTFEGSNFDILVGLSAPFVAWISMRGRAGTQIALAWNWLGLLCLTNTALRFVMTAPGCCMWRHPILQLGASHTRSSLASSRPWQ